MTVDEVISIIRDHGSEASIRAALSSKRTKNLEAQVERHKAVFAKLVYILEKKKVLRRGNIVSLLCSAEGLPDGER